MMTLTVLSALSNVEHRPPMAIASFSPPVAKRGFLQRVMGRVSPNSLVSKGLNVVIGKDVVFTGAPRIHLADNVRLYDFCRLVVDMASDKSGIWLGKNVALNFNCYLDGSGGLMIDDGTSIGPNVVIVSSAHRVNHLPLQQSGKDFAPVKIGKHVWIGGNVVIRHGITIGDNAVIGAGSIVTRDVAADTVVGGNPAREIRKRPSLEAA